MATETEIDKAVPDHQPYVPDATIMPEFTWPAVLAGALLGIVFGASSLYLVLKVGMTVSASIPVAVLSITLFRWLSNTFGIRRATILENNIVQTAGSAGESIAFGVGVTMPALLLIGYEMEWTRIMVVSVLGGLLGILMMIPLRRAFIVKLHGKPGQPGTLLYPEGTACAKVLESGERGGASGKTVFIGFGFAFFHKIATETFQLLAGTLVVPLKLGRQATDAFSRVAQFTAEMAPELLGVGYIIGYRISAIMMGGAVLGSWVILPALAMTTMSEKDRALSFRYIGAGCVAAAGIISMGKTLPMILSSFRAGLGSMGSGTGAAHKQTRTERDMPPQVVLGGCLFLLALLAVFLMQEVNPEYAVLGAFLVLLFGFLFVTVSSRLTGEIGSSSNPISGMTVATLLMTCLIFLALGMTSPTEAVLALSIGGVVCIAASNGGTTSQDLKTGFLVGATPRLQQFAILIGAITSAVVIGGTLLLFASAGTVYSQRNLSAVSVKDRVKDLEQMEEYKGEQFHVWQITKKEDLPVKPGAKETEEIEPGKYLVDNDGNICYLVDPTITGRVEERDDDISPVRTKVRLTQSERKRIPDTLTLRIKQGSQPAKMTVYKLWRNVKPEDGTDPKKLAEMPPYAPDLEEGGLYLVDADGKVTHKVTASKVAMKFKAPKTAVMGVIINGLLGNNLNWAMVIIGACIALMLELCGVSSLAFAVGLYVPMSASAPIFLGGCVRWLTEAYTARQARAEAMAAAPGDAAALAEAEVQAIAKSETSPGMLLASGFIAGGSIGGVLYSFLNFMPKEQLDMIDLSSWANGVFLVFQDPGTALQAFSLLLFLGLAALLFGTGIGKLFAGPPEEPASPQPPSSRSIDDRFTNG